MHHSVLTFFVSLLILQGLEMKLQRLSSGVSAKTDLTLELFDQGENGLLGKHWILITYNANSVHAPSFKRSLMHSGK